MILLATGYSSFVADLIQDSELLEASTKRNDKYTVRRILDVHFSHFRIKPLYHDLYPSRYTDQSEQKNLNPSASSFSVSSLNESLKRTIVPNVFFNILHLAIENNSLDVLRICLKHGLDPNNSGTALKKIRVPKNKPYECVNNVKTARFALNCKYCNKKSIQIKITANEMEKVELSSQLTSFDQVNYSSYSYLVSLPPLFLAVSKCNHAALELLLTYDACPNIQDEFGNTPLHLAVAKQQPCFECVYLLLKHHATSIVLNNQSKSPLDIIIKMTQEKQLNSKFMTRTKSKENETTEAQIKIDPVSWDFTISSVHSTLVSELFNNLKLFFNNFNVSGEKATKKSQSLASVTTLSNGLL